MNEIHEATVRSGNGVHHVVFVPDRTQICKHLRILDNCQECKHLSNQWKKVMHIRLDAEDRQSPLPPQEEE